MTARRFATLVLVAACGGSTPVAKLGNAPATAGDSTLEITDLKFFDADVLGVQLHSDGHLGVNVMHPFDPTPTTGQVTDLAVTLLMSGWLQASVHADGTVTATDGRLAKLLADGSLEGLDAKVQPARIAGDALMIDGKHVTIDPKGVFFIDGGATSIRVEGVHGARSRRTALLVAGLILGGKAAPASGSATTAPGTP